MKIFFDTDMLSYYLSGNNKFRIKVWDEIDCGHPLCLTCVNVYEVLRGLKYKGNIKFEQDFHELLSRVKIFYFDDDAIQKASDIYVDLRKKGVTIGDADIMIASIVIANGGKFVTNNVKHFQNIVDISIENWCEA